MDGIERWNDIDSSIYLTNSADLVHINRKEIVTETNAG